MTATKLCPLAEVADGTARAGRAAPTVDVAVVRVGDEVFALEDVCSHAEFPLTDGEVDGTHDRVRAARFALRPAHRQAARARRPPSPSAPIPSPSSTATCTSIWRTNQ